MESDAKGRSLVIVESPAKARTITRLLGAEYSVTASMGHVRDLPERTLGVDIEHGFKPVYQVQKGNVIRTLKDAAAGAGQIYLASDPDREGEAIAWHIMEILKTSCKVPFRRVTFHEITPGAVRKAFETPGEINMNLVNAQQARRILDRLVGYKISEFLWSRIEKGISAGRVQSVALRIICAREREIEKFKPQEYWNINFEFEADPDGSGLKYKARLALVDGQKASVPDEAEALKVVKAVEEGRSRSIASVETKQKKKYAPPPFITSTMQQAAASYLRFTANHTMIVAQQLYEGIDIGTSGPVGLITYMRTDSVSVAKDAVEACRKFISEGIGAAFLPEVPNKYRSSSRAQEAHEAIRPTDVRLKPQDAAKFLSHDQLKLYSLIWKRFVASQMRPADLETTTVETKVDGSDGRNYRFRTQSTVTVFAGYTKIYDMEDVPSGADDNGDAPKEPSHEEILRRLAKGMPVHILGSAKEQKFTEPPPRFNEAMLIRELETNGIGRPSTYATIINTILKRKYVIRAKGRLQPTELGFKVNDVLVALMPELFDIGFTAKMENELDDIEEGKNEWTAMLEEFYRKFSEWLGAARGAGAPEKGPAEAVMRLFDSVVEWKKPEKKGRRFFNDKRFVDSIKAQFAKNGKLSEKQWKSLIMLALQYKEQIPQLEKAAADSGFSKELAEAASISEERSRTAPSEPASQETLEAHLRLIGEVKLPDEPPKRQWSGKGRPFNPAQFMDSLRKQVEGGRALTEKQLRAVESIRRRHSGDGAAVGAQPPAADGSQAPSNGAAPQQQAPADSEAAKEISRMLESLAVVTAWEEPAKKGRRFFNDKSFYNSLREQFTQKGALSPKQVAALAKLAGKYAGGASAENTQSIDN